VRGYSIVVGCVLLDEEGNEEGYRVQVIRSGGDTFFEVNCLVLAASCLLFHILYSLCFLDKCVIFKMSCPGTSLQKANRFSWIYL
jgi:hypothetical protein